MHQVLPLAKKWKLQEEEKYIFLQWTDTGYINHTSRQNPFSSHGQHKFKSFFVSMFLMFCHLFEKGYREHEVVWAGMWGDLRQV